MKYAEELWMDSYTMNYEGPYRGYMVSNNEYPVSVKTMATFYFDNDFYGDSIDEVIERLQIPDIFSRESGYIAYVPLYNRSTLERESFILYSAGIDGKINHHFSETDTLYIDSWWTKLKVYNYDDFVLVNDYQNKSAVL